MNTTLVKTPSGKVTFCLDRMCFIADGENGKNMATAANILTLSLALLTLAKGLTMLSKVFK